MVSRIKVCLMTALVLSCLWAGGAVRAQVYVGQWGSSGTTTGQFSQAHGITSDSAGNVYVVDTGNARIQKFNSNGAFLGQWGSMGTGNGQFQNPMGIATDSSGNFYVTDLGNARIQKFNSNGAYLGQWGSMGTGNGQFQQPQYIAVDSANNVYVTDSTNQSVQKFTSNGTFITQWGGNGIANGQFNAPRGIAVDSANNVYVADTSNQRIQKFDSNGAYLGQWGSSGTGDGQFQFPNGITTDNSGGIYVTDTANRRVQKFDASGNFTLKWGSLGSGHSQFNAAEGMTTDSSGNIYVVDSMLNRVQKFAPANPPVLKPIPNQTASAGVPVGFTAKATDVDPGDTSTFSLANAPTGASINPTTGFFTWTPSFEQQGQDYTVTVIATDSYGLMGSQDVNIRVRANTELDIARYSAPSGATITLQAILQTIENPTAVVGRNVTFLVDGTAVGTATTNSKGVASLDYTLTQSNGTSHVLRVEFADDGLFSSAFKESSLKVTASTNTIFVPNLTTHRLATIPLQGRLKQAGLPLAGKTLQFIVDGNLVGTAVTDVNGFALLSYMVPGSMSMGTHTLTVRGAGDISTSTAFGTGTITIVKWNTSLSSATVSSRRGAVVSFRGVLRRAQDKAPLSGRMITFKLDGVNLGVGVTDGNGIAHFSYTIPEDATVGDHTLVVEYAGETAYLPSSGSGKLIVGS